MDNDHDGQIVEDFDQDMDGYFSAASCPDGSDCDDTDPLVHSGAVEASDGIDNDCDGTIDEPVQPYTFRFLGQFTDAPIAGVAVWLGIDGTGPSGVSGDDGTVTFQLDDAVQDWSFGYHAAYRNASGSGAREEHRIYTYLDDTLEAEQTLKLTNGYETVDSEDLEVTVTGIQPVEGGSVEVGTNSGTYILETSQETVTFTGREWLDRASFLLASQIPPCVVETCGYMPERFGVRLDPPRASSSPSIEPSIRTSR